VAPLGLREWGDDRGGTIISNTIGVHVADSNTTFRLFNGAQVNMWGNALADVFVGNYQRDLPGNMMIDGSDNLVGAPPVKNVDLSGVSSSDYVVCTNGTYTHSSGVYQCN
jgi:hypothetical protein